MLAKELISDMVFPLKTSDTGIQALNLMDVFRISHLPIVNNKEFLGLISESDIIDMNDPEEAIGNHKLSLQKAYVYSNQHLYDIIELVSKNKLTVVPVLDDSNHYLGLITVTDLLHYIADIFSLKQSGGLIMIEVSQKDYSASEISHIIEDNDAKLLSLYINAIKDTQLLEVVIKINKVDVSSVIQAFERYNYNVKGYFTELDEGDDIYDERYESLMRFLNT